MNKALQENIKEMNDGLEKMENGRKTYAEVLGSQGTQSEHRGSTPNNFQECLETFQEEKEQQAKRKCNLAIVNMPESTAEETDHRVKEDTDFITDVIRQELKMHVQIEKARRVGKKTEDRPRVLIVTLKDEETKWEVLKASRTLRDSENDMVRNLYINKDMTQREREKNRLLREELKNRRAHGENVKIVRGKCVVLKEQGARNTAEVAREAADESSRPRV